MQPSLAPCNAGYFGTGSAGTCRACPEGKFKAYVGDNNDEETACSICNIGYTTIEEASINCGFCAEGYYGFTVDGVVTCRECPAGFYSFVGQDHCKTCPPMMWSSAASVACTICAPGYASGAGASQCSICPAG